MIEIAPNVWINPEQVCSMQKSANKHTGEVKIHLRMSNGEQYEKIDNDAEMLKKVLKVLK